LQNVQKSYFLLITLFLFFFCVVVV